MKCAGHLKLITAPTAIMTTAEAKLFLRVDDNGEDTLIDAMVKASTEMVENYLNRKLITQTWQYWLDDFPFTNKNDWWDGTRDGAITELYGAADEIKLPIGPLQSVLHLKTYDNADVATTFPAANYVVDTVSPQGRIKLRVGEIWPSTVLRPANGIEIHFTVGYGAAADVPSSIIQAVKEVLAAMYERRGDELTKLPMTAMAFCQHYRVNNL